MPSFLELRSSSKTMELDHHHQTQSQLKVPSTSQTAHTTTTTTTLLAYHDEPYKNNAEDEPMIQANNGNSFINHKAFFDSLPPGYRFRPTKEELIENYLLPKINGEILPPCHIRDVNLYEDSPDKISDMYEADEKEWYFFTPRNRKYPKGHRPNRAAGDGYWKATQADVKIFDNGEKIGFKKSLVYFVGKPPNGEKTNWIMHEYRVQDKVAPKKNVASMRLDDYVLCRIYKKNDQQSLKGQNSRQEFQGGSSSNSVKDCNNININNAGESDHSSRLVTSQEGVLLMDASRGHGSNFLINNEATPVLNYGYEYELLPCNVNKEEFEDISPIDVDSFIVVPPVDDHLSLPLP